MKLVKIVGMLMLTGISFLLLSQPRAMAQEHNLLNVVVAGLSHDHVHGILQAYQDKRVNILRIVEMDRSLWPRYKKQYQLADSLFTTDLRVAILQTRPDAVLGYNPVAEHLQVVAVALPLRVPVMLEKPLAANLAQAKEIETLSQAYHVPVLTNFETTWYPSIHAVQKKVVADSIGLIRRMVVHAGHQGPREIGCSEAFLKWLTDPVMNGAGALNDFGCYGADLMTWLMKGQRPLAVTAFTHQYKPNIYPNVDDDASILVEYPQAMGQIEASWNWPFSIKDMELFGERGYLHALNSKQIHTRMRENRLSDTTVTSIPAPYDDPLHYLAAVLKGEISGVNDLSSLEYNMIVMEILDAAKRSAESGKRIVLPAKQ